MARPRRRRREEKFIRLLGHRAAKDEAKWPSEADGWRCRRKAAGRGVVVVVNRR